MMATAATEMMADFQAAADSEDLAMVAALSWKELTRIPTSSLIQMLPGAAVVDTQHRREN